MVAPRMAALLAATSTKSRPVMPRRTSLGAWLEGGLQGMVGGWNLHGGGLCGRSCSSLGVDANLRGTPA